MVPGALPTQTANGSPAGAACSAKGRNAPRGSSSQVSPLLAAPFPGRWECHHGGCPSLQCTPVRYVFAGYLTIHATRSAPRTFGRRPVVQRRAPRALDAVRVVQGTRTKRVRGASRMQRSAPRSVRVVPRMPRKRPNARSARRGMERTACRGLGSARGITKALREGRTSPHGCAAPWRRKSSTPSAHPAFEAMCSRES